MKNFISTSAIIDRVKQHPLMLEMTFEAGIRYIIDAIRLIGVPVLFERKYKEIPITEYRGVMPDDFLEMDMESSVRMISGTETSKNYYPMIASPSLVTPFSDLIEPTRNKESLDFNTNQLKYTIKGNYIIVPFEEGMVDLVYKGLFLDDEGLPSIPDNTKVVKAIEFFIKYNHFRILADLGKVTENTARTAATEYSWYVGAAQTENTLLTLDERQTISNILTNMFIDTSGHSTFFENVGLPEKLRKNI